EELTGGPENKQPDETENLHLPVNLDESVEKQAVGSTDDEDYQQSKTGPEPTDDDNEHAQTQQHRHQIQTGAARRGHQTGLPPAHVRLHSTLSRSSGIIQKHPTLVQKSVRTLSIYS